MHDLVITHVLPYYAFFAMHMIHYYEELRQVTVDLNFCPHDLIPMWLFRKYFDSFDFPLYLRGVYEANYFRILSEMFDNDLA
jgi:hypothetical protein